jgi:dCMP deaminase
MRPSWDETWLEVARAIAKRAPCSRARVGAVVVSSSDRIVATGYNGPPAGMERPWQDDCNGLEAGWCVRGKFGPAREALTSYHDCPTIHAEANALLFCDRREREGGTIYVTGMVCFTCAKLIGNSGLAQVVIGLEDVDRSYRSEEANPITFMEECGLTVVTL